MAKHFDKLCNNKEAQNEKNNYNCRFENKLLNLNFTKKEIRLCIKKLNNNKPFGCDQVINDFLKNSADNMTPIILKPFNLIPKSGIFPEKWTTGIIIPIYKKKGDKENPDNFRGITLLSCLGKLFTPVINRRVSRYLEEYDLIGEEHAGFRSGYITLDHIFSLKCIIDIYLSKNKRLFTATLTIVKLLILF